MTSKLPKTKMRTASAERTTPAGYFRSARTALGITLILLAAAVLFCGAGAAAPSGTAINDLTGLTSAASSGGEYYLDNDISGVSDVSISNNFTLDLNGKTLEAAEEKRLFSVNSGKFTLTDSSSTGGGKLTKGWEDFGGAVYVNTGEFEMKGGSITDCTAYLGGAVYVNTGEFEMTGGNITVCTAETNGGGVCVYSSVGAAGTFNMSGGNISGCEATQYGGGVYNYGGTFEMKGGSITGCTITGDGGGVHVNSGTFTMSAGSITGCKANGNGGGVCVQDGGTFTMSDNAKITGCTATGDRNGGGGGVYVSSSFGGKNNTFTMSGGSITGCSAKNGGGVYIKDNNGEFYMTGGSIGGTGTDACSATNTGGGVYNGGKFEMSGGSITACSATNTGGGVYVSKDATSNKDGKFEMSGGSITGCTAKLGGGGVFNMGGTFTMSGGSITDCTATSVGGGVYNGGEFEMKGGSITDCEALGIGETNGGGVYVYGTFTMSDTAKINKCNATKGGGVYASNGVFTMAGGSITGCNATQNGGGSYIAGDSDCYVSGAAEITENTAQGKAENLYLTNDDMLHLAGAFTGSIGVTVLNRTPAENLKFGIFDTGSGAEKFFSDEGDFVGTVDSNELVWKENIATVTVTFNENGGEGSMAKQAIEIDVPTKLNKNTFKRTGYTFDGWATSEEGAVAYADEEEVTLTEDLDLYAHWTVIKPKPSGGSQDTGSGNYTEYPRTADGNGGVITFGTSKNVKAVELPAGVKGEVILKTKTSEKGPEGEETLLVFEINIRNYPEGTPAGITYEFPLGEIEKTGHTPADYILMHKDSDTQWTELPTTYEVTGTKAVYTAVTTAFSPFAVVYAEGGAKPVDEVIAVVEQTEVPTAVVTAAPTAAPTAVKTAAPTAEPTKAAKSPAALGGLAAGLAAAGLLFGRRE